MGQHCLDVALYFRTFRALVRDYVSPQVRAFLHSCRVACKLSAFDAVVFGHGCSARAVLPSSGSERTAMRAVLHPSSHRSTNILWYGLM